MPSHLLIFSLGPVQDFIATARRCQDLWFGSDLLSELSRAAAAAAAKVGSDALVVPGDIAGGAIANEIVAILPDGAVPTDIATSMRAAVSNALEHRMNSTFNAIENDAGDGANFFRRSVAEAQVRDLIETYWAAFPMPSGTDYTQARADAKRLLAARKNTRNWAQHEEGANVPKSSLDGARASVIDEQAYNRPVEWRRQRFGIKGAERLSGVDLLKRHGQSDTAMADSGQPKPTFHSTSHIASGPMRTRLARLSPAVGCGLVDNIMSANGLDSNRFRIHPGKIATATLCAPAGWPQTSAVVPRTLRSSSTGSFIGLDGYLLYPDRAADILEQSGQAPTAATEKAVRSSIENSTRKTGWRQPVQPYYAFLLADGDRMGKFVSDFLTTTDAHQAFSKALDGWASEAAELVESYLGSCIYAGGDDVLALLPLHTVLDCAAGLRESFEAAMQTAWTQVPAVNGTHKQSFDGALQAGLIPTLSVGVGVSHHMIPMRDALELARSAEKGAKNAGRNALCVKVQKRSGGELSAVGNWSELNPLHDRLIKWAAMFNGEHFPDKVAFALEKELEPLQLDSPQTSQNGNVNVDLGMVRSIVRRALKRRTPANAGDTNAGNNMETLVDAAIDRNPAPIDGKAMMDRVIELSAELQISRLFLDAFNEAWGPVSE